MRCCRRKKHGEDADLAASALEQGTPAVKPRFSLFAGAAKPAMTEEEKEQERLNPLLGLAAALPNAKTRQGFGSSNFVIENGASIKLQEYYEVYWTETLGEGSFGRVVRSKNRSTGTYRAVKTIRKMRKDATDMARKEIKIMKKLAHPNVVKLYETFEDAKYIHMVLEYCAGGDLMEVVCNKGRVTEGQAASVMQQALRGTNFVHKNHICHRDLKLENFMLLTDDLLERNIVKVIDFGLAADCPPGEILSTKAGGPYYVAPQMLAGHYDTKADIWSLGVVMYVLLCGYPPFFGESDAEVLTKVRLGVFTFTPADWRSISEDAKDLIMNMLKMSPADRFTCEQALRHRWFKTKMPEVKVAIPRNMIDNLRAYGFYPRFKKAALFLIAVQLPPDETKSSHDVFTTLDSNGEGLLTMQELREGILKSGISDSSAAEKIVKGVDADDSGIIDYSEFIAATLDKKMYMKDENCWLAFRLFDRQGDGTISKKEIQVILRDGDVGNEMEELGLAQDAKIDFTKFVKIMRKADKMHMQRSEKPNGNEKEENGSLDKQDSTEGKRPSVTSALTSSKRLDEKHRPSVTSSKSKKEDEIRQMKSMLLDDVAISRE